MITTNFIDKTSEAFIPYMDRKPDENTLSGAIQYWFYSLPKYTKITAKQYLGNGRFTDFEDKLLRFKDYLRKPEINASSFLYETLPTLFGETDAASLSDNIINAKNELDAVLPDMVKNLHNDICAVFKCKNRAALGAELIGWYERLPQQTKLHCFDGGEERLFKVILKSDDLVDELAVILTGFTPGDFGEDTPALFMERLCEYKATIEGFGAAKRKGLKNMYSILLDGCPIKTFNKARNISGAGMILLNELTTVVSEYGQSIGIGEKRQILLDVLETLDVPAREIS